LAGPYFFNEADKLNLANGVVTRLEHEYKKLNSPDIGTHLLSLPNWFSGTGILFNVLTYTIFKAATNSHRIAIEGLVNLKEGLDLNCEGILSGRLTNH